MVLEFEGRPAEPGDLKALALYNYGCFTSMTVEGGRVRGLGLHLERLVHDSEQLFGQSVDQERVLELVRHALVEEESDPVVVRVTIFDPDFDMGHPSGEVAPKILVSSRPAALRTGAPAPPARIAAVRYGRDFPTVKHVGLFGPLTHRRAAQAEGFDDVLLVTDGAVAEGATWNIGFIRDGGVVWPKADALPGVTMRLVQTQLANSGVQSSTEPLTLEDVALMDAAFMTNAATGVREITTINEISFPGNESILRTVRDLYVKIPGESL